jgi:SAM-dependent methyltransferase
MKLASGLVVSHKGDHCGVYQYGRNLFETLLNDKAIDWSYIECSSFEELQTAVRLGKPDAILFNHHPSTMPWLTSAPLADLEATLFGLLHQVDQAIADRDGAAPFDFLICLDPTLVPRKPGMLRAPRFLPASLEALPPLPDVFTIGSFGFATPGKGFERLCSLVDAQFERARIRLNLPRHDDPNIVPDNWIAEVVEKCQKAITRPGIELVVTHHFFNNKQIVEFLTSNTMNAFLYDNLPSNGISSCADFALAAGRPFALTRSSMFRHLFHLNPSIFIEDRSLSDIAAGDTHMLEAVRAALAPARAAADWNKTILDAIATRQASCGTPDRRGFNKILDDRSRLAYRESLDDLTKFAPEMMSRKIERANIQQAFALDAAQRFLANCPNARILAAGSFEDTAVATLRAQGYHLEEMDPNVNGMTLKDFYLSPEARLASYDLVLSVSVLEHVAEDEQFVRIVGELLRPGGLAVLTVDFAEKWRPGKRKPEVDHRLYTTRDICERLMPAIGDCVLVDQPSWFEGIEDFEYEGSQYGFAGFVFRKLDAESVRLAARSPVWRELIQETPKTKEYARSTDKMTALKRFFR